VSRAEDQRTPEAVRQYADDVVRLLAADFPDLQDPVVADIVRGHIYRHASDPGGFLEVIVDDPISARWRLVAAPGRSQQGRVRLACRRLNPREADLEREERLNAALQTIQTGD
jgi:hypothetical protein